MKKTLISVGIGAGLMYLLDPELGAIRRSLLKDKLNGTLPKTSGALSAKADAVTAKATELTEELDTAAAETIDSLAHDVIAPADNNTSASRTSDDEKSDDIP